LFKSAISLIDKKEHLTEKGLQKILNIRASMNKGLTKVLLKYFPNTVPENRENIQIKETLDPY
jgi:hypothetical protein